MGILWVHTGVIRCIVLKLFVNADETIYTCRYRHAAVHGTGGGNSVSSSRPRSGTGEPFMGTEVLEGRVDLQLQINKWLGPPC